MKLPFRNASGGHVDADSLSAYLDNQVTPGEKARIEGHLSTCPACRAELNSLRQTVALLQALPRVALPRAFTLSTAQVGARRGSLGWTWGAARALGAVAALVVVAALAVFVFQRPGQQAALPAPMIARNATAPTTTPNLAPSVAPAAQAPAADQSKPAASAPAAAPPMPAAPPAAQPSQAPAAKAGAARPTTAAAGAAQPTLPSLAGAAGRPATAATASQAPEIAASASTATSPEARSLLAPSTAATPPLGLGGGNIGSAGIGAATTSPLPAPAASLAALSGNAGLAYTDGLSLVALDSGGIRTIAQAPTIGGLNIAPDRSWVAYQVTTNNGSGEVWAVRWNGADAHLLAAESTLAPHAGGPTGNAHISDMRWIPGTQKLSFMVAFIGDAGQTAKPELWGASAESGNPYYILDLGQADSYAFSPGGSALAVISRPAPNGTSGDNGKLLLYSSNGQGAAANERTVLNLPAAAAETISGFQLAWLPDGSALWAAIPSANASFPDKPSVDLFRVTAKGVATRAGQAPALGAFWSPNGKALAYTQPTSGDGYQLVLANADGSNPQVYARIGGGSFMSWSPDNRHFIYSNGDQSFVGDGGPPQLMGSVIAPQWSGASQVLYLSNQTNFWAVVSYTLDGKTATVAQIPAGVPVEVTGR